MRPRPNASVKRATIAFEISSSWFRPVVALATVSGEPWLTFEPEDLISLGDSESAPRLG
jgi:hypothetical protein